MREIATRKKPDDTHNQQEASPSQQFLVFFVITGSVGAEG
jgi:hypothetical protein